MLATAKRRGGATDLRRGGLPMLHWFAKAAIEADNGIASLEMHVGSGGGIAFSKGRRASRHRGRLGRADVERRPDGIESLLENPAEFDPFPSEHR